MLSEGAAFVGLHMDFSHYNVEELDLKWMIYLCFT